MKKFLVSCFMILFLAACGVGNTNTTYQRGQIGKRGSTSTGTIVSMEVIDIEGTEGVGTIAGGIAGGAAGSMVGGKPAVNLIGAVGGAVVGGMIGAKAEKAITSDTAFEFLVQEDKSGDVISIVQSNELGLQPGDHVILIELDGVTRIRSKMVGYQKR
ncbi:MAG: glycine zipper 2TM domain-containing protein [Alphaproteobacteria bacterium]|nr:glycine zipper 2TM domain-containing protein [Alphaproteobacteria bacterium]